MVHRPNSSSSGAPLAEVIPLERPRAASRTPPLEPGAPEIARARASMERAIDLLERRASRWSELPTALGHPAATAESLLGSGPTGVDPWTASPLDAAGAGEHLAQAAMALADQMGEEAEVLGDALGAEIGDLSLRHLDDIVVAVIDLSRVNRVETAWASPLAANTAQVIVDVQEASLRGITQLHHDLYADFTDHVLDIPESRLHRGRRLWRPVNRVKLRRGLAAASRTGRVPGRTRAVADQVLEVHVARRHLTSLAPLLSTHLGREGWGPLGDVDALVGSLSAVRRLQRVLGERLSSDRMAALLAADAFQASELVGPATNLRVALESWRDEVTSLGGGDPFAMPAEALAEWAATVADALPAITAGAEAMHEIDGVAETLRDLVDDLLLRDKVAELGAWLETWADDGKDLPRNTSGSAS